MNVLSSGVKNRHVLGKFSKDKTQGHYPEYSKGWSLLLYTARHICHCYNDMYLVKKIKKTIKRQKKTCERIHDQYTVSTMS